MFRNKSGLAFPGKAFEAPQPASHPALRLAGRTSWIQILSDSDHPDLNRKPQIYRTFSVSLLFNVLQD
jgi:hypothetical protein